MVQRLVRVSDVDVGPEQRTREILAGGAMAFDRESLVGRLVPRVLSALIVLPRLEFDRVVRENRERRNAVFAEILVLIVAPDEHEIGLEAIELAPDLAELLDHVVPVPLGMRAAVVVAPLLARRRVPARRIPKSFG